MEVSKDLELLEKVMMRFALATDDQLEKQIQSLLIPVLVKLNSNQEQIRKKVIEILSHINKRIKPLPQIKLPISDLIDLINDPNTSVFAHNFANIYLDLGFGRCSQEEKLKLFPSLVSGISKRAKNQQEILLNLIVSIVDLVPTIVIDEQKEIFIPPFKNESDTQIILDYFLDILLAGSNSEETGLSANTLKKILEKFPKDSLFDRKLGILKFLFNQTPDLFSHTAIAPHFIVASCDSNYQVVSKGEDNLKRLNIDYENDRFVMTLYKLFLGEIQEMSNIPPDDKRTPVNSNVRSKILTYLSRSKLAANKFPITLKVIFQCIYGTEKVRQSGMFFVQWVFKIANNDQINQMGPIILSGLLKLISDSQSLINNKGANELKGFLFSSIGLLSKRIPSHFSNDLSILELYFSRLSLEDSSILSSIQEGLLLMCSAYQTVSDDKLIQIAQILLSVIKNNSSYQSKFCGLYFFNRLFKFDYVPARFACLLCTADNRPEVKDEAYRGLKPFIRKESDIVADSSQPYPDFVQFVKFLMQEEQKNDKSQEESSFPPLIYEEFLKFLQATFQSNAKKEKFSEIDYVTQLIQTEEITVLYYLKLIERGLNSSHSNLHHLSLEILLSFICLKSDYFGEKYAPRFEWLLSLLYVGNLESRERIGKVIGLVSPHVSQNILFSHCSIMSQKLVPNILASSNDEKCSAIYGLSSILSRCNQLNKPFPSEFTLQVLFQLYTLLDQNSSSIVAASCQAIGWIGRYLSLPLSKEKLEGSNVATSSDQLKLIHLVHKLITKLDSTESKVVEKSALGLVNLTLGDKEFPFQTEIIEALFSTAKCKSEEIHFTVGEALSCIGSGWKSGALTDLIMDTNSIHPDFSPSPEIMQVILKKLFEEYLPKDTYRSAVAIWILSLVTHSGKDSVIQSSLSSIQKNLSFLLSDNNEVTQEVASRALVFVYEIGDENTKKALVQDLIETFSSSKKHQLKVTEETKILPDTLGKTPDGSTLSTYKEMCSLANEMGKPDMIYKFMNLSNHNALWNSRKGAAFAATTIMAQAKEQLQPHLPFLVPKLYRYSYDPNPKIAQAMGNILNALVDMKHAKPLYFKGIMKELVDSLNSNLWRVREGSCLALSDALQGCQFEDVKDYLDELWYKCFKVADDIKETVRKAADIAIRTLSGLTVRLCDPSQTSPAQGKQAIDIALPTLLKKGLVNEAESVKQFSAQQILKIAKNAGFLFIPHIPETVSILLQGLSSLEPAAFNYLSFHTKSLNITDEQFDQTRLELNKGTPLSETLEICVKYVDSSNVDELVGKLLEVIKQGVGLPTRYGTAKFIATLGLQKVHLFKPYSTKLINAMMNTMTDRSPPVRKEFAVAIAYLAKVASPKTMSRLIEKLEQLYSTGDEISKSACATILSELSKKSPESLKSLEALFLPLVFIGKYDAEVGSTFKSVWDEMNIGSGGAYLSEIITYLIKKAESESWEMKKQSALAISELANSVGAELKPFLNVLLKQLAIALSGKLWKGKEALLTSLSAICTVGVTEIENKHFSQTPQTIVDLLLSQCKKTDKDFKRKALTSLAEALKTFQHTDLFANVQEVLFNIASGKEEEIDELEANDKPLSLLVKASAFQALGNAWIATSKETQMNYGVAYLHFLLTHLAKNTWNIKLEILKALGLFGKYLKQPSILENAMAEKLISQLFEALQDTKYNQIRSTALDSLAEFMIFEPILTNYFEPLQKKLNEVRQEPMLQTKADTLLGQLAEHHPSKKRKSDQ